MTNAEKIRQMTDEELAEMFEKLIKCCESCRLYESCVYNGHETCRSTYLKWLKEEANDVGNCADCRFSLSDGDLGFVCCNGKSEQYGQYSGGCDKYKEADDG